jgi:hypothetical protein
MIVDDLIGAERAQQLVVADTALPTSITAPARSLPRISGIDSGKIGRRSPLRILKSTGLTLAARIRTNRSRAPTAGRGRGRWPMIRGDRTPYRSMYAAFTVAN